MQRPSNTKLNERGFASIVIALILIIVLALLTVGFAQLARREQQTALDKQKATQANYAAESGINNAYKDILSGKITDSNASSTQCMTGPSGRTGTTQTLPANALSANENINVNNGVSYSCLLVSLSTPNVGSDNNSPGSGHHMNFSTQDNLTSITVYWGSDTGNNTNFPADTTTNFPSLGSWNGNHYPPVVELSITPTSGLSGNPSNPSQYLAGNTSDVFLYPSKSGNNSCSTTTSDPTACSQGQVLSGSCNPNASRPPSAPPASTMPCSAVLTGLGDKNYVIHYVDFYDTSSVYLYGIVNAGGTPTPAQFTGEPVIDVTGKARDVLKRLRVRLFINGGVGNTPDDNAILPNGAIEAQNICKRIQAAPSTTDFPAGSSYDKNITSIYTPPPTPGNPNPSPVTVYPCVAD